MWHQWSFQPWHHLWIGHSKVTGPYVQLRALRYYLDRTSDLRQNKELVFVSFRKEFDKDISPSTISSLIKQTVILCYELSDRRPSPCIRLKPMMLGPLLPLRPSNQGSPESRYCQPAIGNLTTPSLSFI